MDSTFDTGLGSSGRKATILAIIVGFHVLLVWALMTSLGTIIVDRLPPIIKAEIIEEIQQDDTPPPPPPTIETPPPYVPPPDIVIDVPVSTAAPTGALVTTSKPAPPAPPPVVKAGIKKSPEIDPKYRRRFQPEYPPTSRRLGEEGSVVLQVLIAADGSVKDGKVQTSSGFPRLDEA
ncbi:MAG: TonB family protein, partial [Gammaproteobacteria bacterium]